MRSGGGIAAGMANSSKVVGPIIVVESDDFMNILRKTDSPLVVHSKSGIFTNVYQYMTAYKGFIFFSKSTTPLQLDHRTEIISAKNIWIPG
jgi:hypothetical protein